MSEERYDLDRVVQVSKLYRELTEKEQQAFRTAETLFTVSEVLK